MILRDNAPRGLRGPCFRLFAAILLGLFAAGPARADPKPLGDGIGSLEAGSRSWDLDLMEDAVSCFAEACQADPDSGPAHYWKGAALFHVLLYRLGGDSPDGRRAAGKVMEEATIALQRAVTLDPGDGESHALLATILGMRIADSPASALWRGPAVMRHQKLAMRANPGNPRAHYLLGMSRYYAPSILGGKEKALASLRKAAQLFEKEQRQRLPLLTPRWGRDHCLAFLGRTYQDLGQVKEAIASYREALETNPKHELAREGLRQCLEKQRNEPR